MGNRGSLVSSVPAQQLDKFIEEQLRPCEDCERLIQTAVDAIRTFLPGDSFPHVQGVATGGSYGRKTVLRGNSDGTIVFFLEQLEQFQDEVKSPDDILNAIAREMEQRRRVFSLLPLQWETLRTPPGLSIVLSTQSQKITFEVLFAFDALGLSEDPSPCLYRELIRSMDKTKASPGQFAVCFVKLQQQFFNKYPQKVKDLILLIKYWFQQWQKRESRAPLPTYALELLVVYAWEQGCGAEDSDLAEGVRAILGLILKWQQLCVYWTVYYSLEDETVRNRLMGQLRSQRPVILDPVDLTHNVDGDIPWLDLQVEAQAWLFSLSPSPAWSVLPAPLFMTPAHRLDQFIKEFLQPNKDFLEQILKAVEIICEFLRENCFRLSTTKVQNIIKGGSATKGTALKTGSDADIIVFLDSLKSFSSQKINRSTVIQEIRKQLQACQQQQAFEVKFEVSRWTFPRVLSFSLSSKELRESVDFDVLPAYNALGQSKSTLRAYTELIDLYRSSDTMQGGEFSTCFTELQRDFIRSRPIKLKDLIRLVKHWYKQCERKMKSEGSLPPKYALELLTIYAWEQGSGVDDFSTAEGFRTVLELITKYRQLCIYWTVNYSFRDEVIRRFLLTQIQRPGDGLGNSIQPWKVPTVQTPGSCGARTHPVVNEMLSLRSHLPGQPC